MKNISRRGFFALGASAALSAALAGCSPAGGEIRQIDTAEEEPSEQAVTSDLSSEASESVGLRFYTGLQSGTYYHFGEKIAEHAQSAAKLEISVLSSDGSRANVEALADGAADLALCQSDIMTYAHEGTNFFDGSPNESFSSVALLYEEPVQVVTCDSEITSIADLEGKRVSVGTTNSGVYLNAMSVLDAYGLSENDITPTYQSFADSIDSLKNEEIDASFIVSGAPAKVITQLADEKKTYLIEIDDEHAQKIVADNKHLVRTVIPANTYSGQTAPVSTVASGATLVASNEVSEDVVYKLLSDLFASIEDPAVVASYDKYKELSLEKAASIATVAYHPGAARFYAEKGLSVPSA